MENAADALKLGFGIVVFILALTLLFRTVSIARATAETLITQDDKTTYYTYIPSENNPLTENTYGDATVVSRIVTLEDMIPTIYRYSIESYGVTIIDPNIHSGIGYPQIIARFEKETENLCSTYNRASSLAKENIMNEINTYVLEPVGMQKIKDQNELLDLFKRIYAQAATSDDLDYECPWNGRDEWIAQRIDSDLSGHQAYFSYSNPGVQQVEGGAKNHIPSITGGIIAKYKNSRFTEYIITHDANNPILGEDGDKFYIGENSRNT